MLHAVEFVVFWNFLTQVMFHAKKCCNLWYGLLILFPGILSLKTFLEASKLHKYLDSIIVMPGNSDDGWQVDVSPPSLRCNAMLYCCHWYLYTTTSQSKPDLSPWDNMLSRLFCERCCECSKLHQYFKRCNVRQHSETNESCLCRPSLCRVFLSLLVW